MQSIKFILALLGLFLTDLWSLVLNQVGSVTVDQTWVPQFHNTISLTYQQKGSLLEGTIDPLMVHRGLNTVTDHHERLGNVLASDVISPFAQMDILNPAHSRRAVTLQSSKATVLVSDEHTLRAMVNPQSAYTQTIVFALGRRADKHLIDASTGLASVAAVTAGSGVITYTTQILLSSHMIGGATAFDLDRAINANELLSKASAPSGASERIMLYSPGQLRDILAITQASSSDFTKNQIHDTGTINGVSWQGFRWIEIADVVSPSLSVLERMLAHDGSSTRTCVAFHKGAMGLSIAREIQTDIGPRRDLAGLPTQVDARIMMAAVRVWEGGVVQVDALEN